MKWLDHVNWEHKSVLELEEWLQSLSHFAREHERGEIDELFEAAALGLLVDSDEATAQIKPIRYDPEIFELRRKALGKALRFYHGEPDRWPTHLVAVHRHIKTNERKQQSEIEYASDRYRPNQDPIPLES